MAPLVLITLPLPHCIVLSYWLYQLVLSWLVPNLVTWWCQVESHCHVALECFCCHYQLVSNPIIIAPQCYIHLGWHCPHCCLTSSEMLELFVGIWPVGVGVRREEGGPSWSLGGREKIFLEGGSLPPRWESGRSCGARRRVSTPPFCHSHSQRSSNLMKTRNIALWEGCQKYSEKYGLSTGTPSPYGLFPGKNLPPVSTFHL